MAGMVLKKSGMALLAVLKWVLLAALKRVFGMAGLSLLLPALAVWFVSPVSGVSSGRR